MGSSGPRQHNNQNEAERPSPVFIEGVFDWGWFCWSSWGKIRVCSLAGWCLMTGLTFNQRFGVRPLILGRYVAE